MKIKCDSRLVKPGDTFIALKGVTKDGHDYIREAIQNGAKKIVAEYGNYEVDTEIVNDTRKYLIEMLKKEYYEKVKDLKLIGVTGTNGKTTTCFLLYQALNQAGIKTAYIGTIGFYIDKKKRDLQNTTPDILMLYELLLECKEEQVSYVVMEVSSHALAMNRVSGLEFDYAIFSNLTKDHLDYHLDMKSYALAKQKLFFQLKRNGVAIVNMDDDYKNFFFVHNNTITYGLKEGDYRISEYEIDIHGSKFLLNGEEYQTKLIGKYNLYNMLAVIIVLRQLRISHLPELISKLESPKGRMEMIPYQNNIIVIDYAHTPDAVYNIINSFQEMKHHHIYTVIGCGGNRDKTKRPIMGEIATKLSDYVIFTNDNPRNEEPMAILRDITQGLSRINYEIEENRAIAIRKAVQKCQKSDILLVLGKGHEEYQVIKEEKIHFSDREIIEDLIKQ